MSRSWMVIVGAVLATAGMTGCQNSLKKEHAMLTGEVAELQAQLDDRNAALESCHQELRAREQQLSQVRRDMDTTGVATGFENIPGVTGTLGAGEVTATVESDLLFDSGRATLKEAAKRSLDAMAQVLNSTYSGRQVRIAGHTDSDPIRKSGFKSNYHLGFERAYAVREHLISRGVDQKRIYLASFGPDVPKGGKAQSRRVETVVVLQ